MQGLLLLIFLITPFSTFAVTPSQSNTWSNFSVNSSLIGQNIEGIYIIGFIDPTHVCSGSDISFSGSASSIYYKSSGTLFTDNTFSYIQSVGRIDSGDAREPLADPGLQGSDKYLCAIYSIPSGSWTADSITPFRYMATEGGEISTSTASSTASSTDMTVVNSVAIIGLWIFLVICISGIFTKFYTS